LPAWYEGNWEISADFTGCRVAQFEPAKPPEALFSSAQGFPKGFQANHLRNLALPLDFISYITIEGWRWKRLVRWLWQ